MQGFSQAADNNKAPILKGLSQWLPSNAHVLELGSGAGQHAIFLGVLDAKRHAGALPAFCRIQRQNKTGVIL